MGRYVTGDWDWKFAFADQGSTFGEVLEQICEDLEETYMDRYVGTNQQGEIVKLNIEDVKEFVKSCLKFIGEDFKIKDDTDWCKCNGKFGTEYWNKVMIYKFLKDNENFKDEKGETFEYHVEY